MTWELVHNARPWTTNHERRLHHMARHALVKEWRDAFRWLAVQQRIPHLAGPIIVTATAILADRRRQDADACHPCVKAAIDGLVDAGVIDDDNGDYVAAIVYVRPTLGAGYNALTLRIEEA